MCLAKPLCLLLVSLTFLVHRTLAETQLTRSGSDLSPVPDFSMFELYLA